MGVLVAALLVIAPVLAIGWAPYFRGDRRAPIGDHAGIELYTREALSQRQRVGPYSRFAFHHPGPAFFYLAAPLYRASGERYAGIEATAASLAAAGIGLMVACAWLAGGAPAGWTTALVLALGVALRGAGAWASPWNPNVAAVAFGAFLFVLPLLATGRWPVLPWALAAASLAVQCHIGCAPVVAGLGALALAFAWRASRPGRGVLIRAGIVAGAFWALPALDAARPGRGNLGDLWAFLLEPHARNGLVDVTIAVASAFAAPARGGAAFVGVALLVGAALWARSAARRRAAPATEWLASFSLLGLLLAELATLGAVGPLYGYLLRWVGLLGLAALAAAAHMLLLELAERRPVDEIGRLRLQVATAALVVALGATGGWAAWLGEGASAEDSRRVVQLAESLAARLDERGVRRPIFVVADAQARPLVLGLFLELDKQGLLFAVKSFNVIRFPPGWQPGREDATVRVESTRGAGRAAGETLARDGAFRFVLLRDGGVTGP